MTDYTVIEDYSAKDALLTGNPDKLILGSELELEFDAIAVAIASKYDSSDIATQAQAEAGASNTTLITPLRMAQFLGGNGGGSGAGMLFDIIGLADPNADRGLFWDDSEGTVALFSTGTGLAFSGTSLGLSLGAIDHDALLNFVANEHIDHSAVSISGAGGLTGGGTIASNRTLTLDVTSLTAETTVDTANDYVLMYDASEGANNKVLVQYLTGDLVGDGKWYKGATQSLSAATEATVAPYTADYNALTRGTFDTTAGTYTAGASGARILATCGVTLTALNAGATFELIIQQNSVDAGRQIMRNDADSAAAEVTLKVVTTLSLAAGIVVRVRAESSSAETIDSGIAKSYFSIVELG